MSTSFYKIVESAIEDVNGVKMPLPLSENFDKCLSHINNLLSSAIFLCTKQYYNQALFLAITAVEESVKAEIYCFRSNNSNPKQASKDCLKNHEKKHKAAVNKELLLIGTRVQNVIGEELTKKIYDNFTKAKTTRIREDCLYFEVKDDQLILPTNNISPQLALSYILACIEIIDDQLVGWTNYSMEVSKSFDEYFEIARNMYYDIK